LFVNKSAVLCIVDILYVLSCITETIQIKRAAYAFLEGRLLTSPAVEDKNRRTRILFLKGRLLLTASVISGLFLTSYLRRESESSISLMSYTPL